MSPRKPLDPSAPWRGWDVPSRDRLPPTMLAHEEVEYLVWLTETQFRGSGAVVDLGPWLGSSTCALAEGVRRGGRPGRIQAFDNFVWRRDYMESHHAAELPDHSDFRFLFDRFTRSHADRIEAHAVDLHHYRWTGGPIEILFVDAAKDWNLANNILASFGEALVPGKSLLVSQDYQHWSTYYLPLIFGSRPDLWEPLHMTGEGHIATLRPLKPVLGPGGIEERYSRASFGYADAARLLRRLAGERSGRNRLNLLACLLRLAALEKQEGDVADLREEILRDPANGELAPQLDAITDTLWEDLERGWELRAAGRAEEALGIARSALARHPGEPYLRTLLAWSLSSLDRLEEAEREFDDLVREAPAFTEGWLNRGKFRAERRRFAEAKTDAERARSLAGSLENIPTDYFEVLAQVLRHEGDLEGAIAAVTRIAERSPHRTPPLLWRARLLRDAGREADALADVRRARDLGAAERECEQVFRVDGGESRRRGG